MRKCKHCPPGHPRMHCLSLCWRSMQHPQNAGLAVASMSLSAVPHGQATSLHGLICHSCPYIALQRASKWHLVLCHAVSEDRAMEKGDRLPSTLV